MTLLRYKCSRCNRRYASAYTASCCHCTASDSIHLETVTPTHVDTDFDLLDISHSIDMPSAPDTSTDFGGFDGGDSGGAGGGGSW